MSIAPSRRVLKVTTSQNDDFMELRIEGELTAATINEVERLSRGYLSEGRKLALQLASATFADRAGAGLLRELKKRGVILNGCSGFFQELLRDSSDSVLSS